MIYDTSILHIEWMNVLHFLVDLCECIVNVVCGKDLVECLNVRGLVSILLSC